jgi:DNA-binding LytR/AlgR family response regulator
MQPADITFIFLKVEKKLIKVELAEMMYVESMGDYLKIHTIHQVYITYMTLNKLESLVPASRFIRIHRSTIINTSFISFIEGNFVKINSVELPIGLTYRDGLMKRLS